MILFQMMTHPHLQKLQVINALKEQLNEVLSTLTDREAKVLKLRFGLEDGRSRTLEEVGKEFDVTRERIRQIGSKSIAKIASSKQKQKSQGLP